MALPPRCKLVIATVTTLVIGVVALAAYNKITVKEHERVMAKKKNCEYLGRIFGTDYVIVVDCAGVVQLVRTGDIEDAK